jgi:branched-chain amino acid transport system ATP-binding protein
MRVVMTVCDRVVVLDHGEKIGEGSPAEARRAPEVIKAYLGDESAHA